MPKPDKHATAKEQSALAAHGMHLRDMSALLASKDYDAFSVDERVRLLHLLVDLAADTATVRCVQCTAPESDCPESGLKSRRTFKRPVLVHVHLSADSVDQ